MRRMKRALPTARMMCCSNVSCADAVDPAEFIDLAESAVAALELEPSSAGQDTSTLPPLFEPIYRGDVHELERLLSAPEDVVHVSVEKDGGFEPDARHVDHASPA